MEQLKILLVEHSHDLRSALVRYLHQQPDFVVAGEASNGPDALQLLEKKAFDLIVTCILMPGMDGFAMLERLQETRLNPKPEIIVLSALARQAWKDRAYELGAGFYLVKPVDPELLCACIRKSFPAACGEGVAGIRALPPCLEPGCPGYPKPGMPESNF